MNNPRSHFRILMVEDTHDLAESVSDLLSVGGHEPTVASTCSDAFKKIAEQTFDVILLDLNLGTESGVDLVESVRNAGILLPPVVICSAQPYDQVEYAKLRTGARECLIKPYTLARLNAAMLAAMGMAEANSQSDDDAPPPIASDRV